MLCPQGHDNPAQAAFCNTCGVSLAATPSFSQGTDERAAEIPPATPTHDTDFARPDANDAGDEGAPVMSDGAHAPIGDRHASTEQGHLQGGASAHQVPVASPPAAPSRWWGTVAVAALLLAVVIAIAFAVSGQSSDSDTPTSDRPATPEPLPLEQAYDACSSGEGADTLTLGDAGKTIIIDTGSEYGSIDGAACVMTQLDTSEAIVAQMDSTTAMMGVQDASDGDIAYQWSYHPDNGLNMVITDNSGE